MVLNSVLSIGSIPNLGWSLKTIYEMPTVAVNNTHQVRLHFLFTNK